MNGFLRFLRSLCWWRHPAHLKAVIVNLTDSETAFRGVLWRERGPYLILKQAAALRVSQEATALDGDVVVERDKVLFLQVL